MKTSNLVEFKSNLFFGGAVQIDWFHENSYKAENAASSFVFHGPKYHGVSSQSGFEGHRFVDTATFTEAIVDASLDMEKDEPIALVIAGYGTGKSHLAVTLATLLRKANTDIESKILSNLSESDHKIGSKVKDAILSSKPCLIITLNGMKDFNLASELSRQVLNAIEDVGLPIKSLESLWPRFKIPADFCTRNYSVRQELFDSKFNGSPQSKIEDALRDHDEKVYELVNEIYYQTVGSYINAVGQESPQDLFRTVVDEFCGESGYFQGIVVFFDEFGRYLEFAAQRPQIAGDAAIQQLFEAVQSNSRNSFLVCFNQYELRAYLSRIASELQVTLQRYVTRFDSARKYYLSSNLETLFAHLLRKKDQTFLESYLTQPLFKRELDSKRSLIEKTLNHGREESIWSDPELFNRVIVQGCWPLDPIATWVLSNIGGVLQNRSAIAILKNVLLEVEHEIEFDKLQFLSTTYIAEYGLVDEFLANEKYGLSGSEAELYTIIENKLANVINEPQKHILLSILLFNKLHVSVTSDMKANIVIGQFAGLDQEETMASLGNLQNEHGVIEWNSTQKKYDLISDAIPRSRFTSYLTRKVQAIDSRKLEAIFISNSSDWCRLKAPISSFNHRNNIGTTEWSYNIIATDFQSLPQVISTAYSEWMLAIDPNLSRGSVIYCYFPRSTKVEITHNALLDNVKQICMEKEESLQPFPFYIVPIIDQEGELGKLLSEYFILTSNLPSDDVSQFRHFIEDYKSFLQDELPRVFDKTLRDSKDYIVFHTELQESLSTVSIRQVPDELFAKLYPSVVPFPFDGFSTLKGNAAKDCRELTIELIQGGCTPEWLRTKNTQFQNRFKNLLEGTGTDSGSWGFFDQRGILKHYPVNPIVRSLIEELESTLGKSKEKKIYDILNEWIRPPFGLNLASAGVLLSAFIASRSETLSILIHGKTISRANWLLGVLGKSFIERGKVEDSVLKILEISHIDEWKKLLEKWESSAGYTEQISFEDVASELELQIGAPSESLQYKWEMLIERNREAREAKKKKRVKFDGFEEEFSKSVEKQNAGSLIYLCKKIMNTIDEMSFAVQNWTTLDSQEFVSLLQEVKESIPITFSNWLENLYVGNVSQVETFEKINKSNANTLRKLDMLDLARELEWKVDQLTRNLNAQRKISRIFDAVETFRRTHYFTGVTTLQEVEAIVRKAKQLIGDLNRLKNESNVKALDGQIVVLEKEYIDEGEKQKTKLSERLAKYYEIMGFGNIDEIRDAKVDLETLKKIFQGRDNDLEDINEMLIKVRKMLDAGEFLEHEKHHMSVKMLARNIDQLENEYNSINEDESDIMWDFRKTIDPIFQSIESKISLLSENWIKDHVEGVNIDDFGFAACRDFLAVLSNIPPYLTEDHHRMVSSTNIRLQEKLSIFKVEMIIQQFTELDAEQQSGCLVEMKKIAESNE